MSGDSRIVRILDRGYTLIRREGQVERGRFKRMAMYTDVEQARRAAGSGT